MGDNLCDFILTPFDISKSNLSKKDHAEIYQTTELWTILFFFCYAEKYFFYSLTVYM